MNDALSTTRQTSCHLLRPGHLGPQALCIALLAGLLVLATACDEADHLTPSVESQTQQDPAGESTAETTTVGPVSATVRLTPAEATLGDPVVFELMVEAQPNVDVRMPAFGDQLGRFGIVDFIPRQETTPEGGTRASQRYTLDLPMSGQQRIPSLLVEFVDNRPSHEGDPDELLELLTEELTIKVASVLPADPNLQAEMRPARGPLPAIEVPTVAERWGLWLVLPLLLIALVAGVLLWRRFAARRAIASADDIATRQLDTLTGEGLPNPETVDNWYVRLSDIVRRYIEGRYRLRAPELTTEEFLRVAAAATALQPEHADLLRLLLERADKVKFAAYMPEEAESKEALKLARRFLDESRPTGREDREGRDLQPTPSDA